MKVKELIEALQKQDPEYNIHIWVDDEVGCGAGEFGKYHATSIDIDGYNEFYINDDGEIHDLDKIEEDLMEENYNDDISINELYEHIFRNYKKIKGLWITIKP